VPTSDSCDYRAPGALYDGHDLGPLGRRDSELVERSSYPLPPTARAAFLEHCAREIANLPELGDGVLHRTIVRVQKMYFDP